jgi:hypothetical protein
MTSEQVDRIYRQIERLIDKLPADNLGRIVVVSKRPDGEGPHKPVSLCLMTQNVRDILTVCAALDLKP